MLFEIATGQRAYDSLRNHKFLVSIEINKLTIIIIVITPIDVLLIPVIIVNILKFYRKTMLKIMIVQFLIWQM